MASLVFHIHADTEAIWLQTTSVELLRLENFGHSFVFLFELHGDNQRVSEERTFSENAAYFRCKFVGLHCLFLRQGPFPAVSRVVP
jgi:hypothetical protein